MFNLKMETFKVISFFFLSFSFLVSSWWINIEKKKFMIQFRTEFSYTGLDAKTLQYSLYLNIELDQIATRFPSVVRLSCCPWQYLSANINSFLVFLPDFPFLTVLNGNATRMKYLELWLLNSIHQNYQHCSMCS